VFVFVLRREVLVAGFWLLDFGWFLVDVLVRMRKVLRIEVLRMELNACCALALSLLSFCFEC